MNEGGLPAPESSGPRAESKSAGTASAARVPARADIERCAAARPPAKAVTLLMPVWGYRFVSQFLEFTLRTLLAPGNIPAIAGMMPCQFVLLSSDEDARQIRSHPAWHELERYCAAEIRSIDDLITDGNHTATITLAFARAVREAGDAMLDTCFIFLVSDYLVANGSLRTVVERIRNGASGVVAGNYQIVAEDAIPLLRYQIDPTSTSFTLEPRELVAWSLAHLHPATVANIVNFGLSHNTHVNRLFWRVDENTLIGRFYLLHMIGIRPEVKDFIVGASCDYSFIPEMCPSGNVVALTDSDEYLVVEMQPRDHESKNLLPGPLGVRNLAKSLSEWTTTAHRRNIEHTFIYHAQEIPHSLSRFIAEANAFLTAVRALLTPEPQPHRHHHYWIGSIAVNRARSRRPLGKQDWAFLLGEAVPSGGLPSLIWRLRAMVFGSPPDVTRLHPRWPDYGLPLKALKRISVDGRLLLVANEPSVYASWLTRATNDVETLECVRLLELPRNLYLPLVGKFDCCLMVLTEEQVGHADELLARIGPLLGPGGRIMILITNNRSLDSAAEFSRAFARHSGRLVNSFSGLAEVHYVPASRTRWAIYRAMDRIAILGGKSGWRSPSVVPLLAFAGAALALAAYLCNLGTRATSTPPCSPLWSSVFLILRRGEGALAPLPTFGSRRESSVQLAQGDRHDRLAKAESPAALSAPASCAGSDVVHEEPKRLGIALARYRFVAGLLDHCHDVAECGGCEVLGTRLMMTSVRKLTVYDADPLRVAELLHGFPEESFYTAHVHDILSGPLPKRHDAVYSLDTIQYVSRSEERLYARNLCDSLIRDQDILIVGSPSYEALEIRPISARSEDAPDEAAGWLDAAPALFPPERSTIAMQSALFLRSTAELRALFGSYFHTVFSFSMVEDMLHVGMLRSADYGFVVCCNRRA